MSGLRNVARVAFGIALVAVAVLAMSWLFLYALIGIGALANFDVLFGVAAVVAIVALGANWVRRRSN